MRKSPHPENFGDKLDRLLADEEKAGLGPLAMAQAMEGRAQRLRGRHNATSPVESAYVPKLTTVGGDGNLAQRLGALLRGEQ
jgi:hypothetical protein